MKRLCAYCLLFFLVALQHAWTAEAFDTALFIPRSDAFWTTFASYTKAAADDIGLNLEVYNAKENQQTMLKQVEAVCKKSTDAIIFMNYQGIGETIKQLVERFDFDGARDETLKLTMNSCLELEK